MAKAFFKGGSPVMRDYTTGAEETVEQGDVVVIGDRPCICHTTIPPGTLGALAIHGGLYQLDKDDDTGPDISDGDELYWDTEEGADTASTGNTHFGPAVQDAGTDETPVLAFHLPRGETGST